MNDYSKTKNKIIIIGVTLFLLSLTQKCYCTTSTCGDSIMAFLMGWFAMLSGSAGISWLANPLIIAAWLLLYKSVKASLILSSFAILFALSFLLFDSIIANESGQAQQITAYKAGYWIWVLSCATTWIALFGLQLKLNTDKALQQKQPEV